MIDLKILNIIIIIYDNIAEAPIPLQPLKNMVQGDASNKTVDCTHKAMQKCNNVLKCIGCKQITHTRKAKHETVFNASI